MHVLRTEIARFALAVLVWQLVVLLVLPTALCCAAASTGTGASPVCPMHHKEGDACPMHASPRSSAANRPSLGCSFSDQTLLALLGPMAILPSPTPIADLPQSVQIIETRPVNVQALAVTPAAPPPRS